MIMVYLKEDGSLDVERINELPFEEITEMMGSFTREQMKEYISKIPVTESRGTVKVVKINYRMEDMLARGCATTEQILNIIRQKCEEIKMAKSLDVDNLSAFANGRNG